MKHWIWLDEIEHENVYFDNCQNFVEIKEFLGFCAFLLTLYPRAVLQFKLGIYLFMYTIFFFILYSLSICPKIVSTVYDILCYKYFCLYTARI